MNKVIVHVLGLFVSEKFERTPAMFPRIRFSHAAAVGGPWKLSNQTPRWADQWPICFWNISFLSFFWAVFAEPD
jgi:hypothetical protein